ncbi:MAG: von Willebrand factor type A domain-containing protein [Sedimentisphaerales bacterium]|nr:von Willebrand factor type A domain-containing protein [Sedimentisphaerales bacterium]
MKNKDNNLEKNISRLVKQVGDSDTPSKAFTNFLIDDALGELKQPVSRQRDRRSTVMKVTKIFAYAAAILIVSGILLALIMPLSRSSNTASFSLNKEKSEHLAKSTELAAKRQERFLAHQYSEADKLGISTKLYWDESAAVSKRCFALTKSEPGGYPMAHGGTTPPNGEDVDAMFFKNYGVNPFIDTEDDHLSTFATDVDTGSYTVIRGYLHDGHLPPRDAVRVEEFVNYFKYNYAAPQEDDFAVYTEAAPWSFGAGRKNSYLMRIGLKGKQVSEENRKPAILTFVIDVSGSMSREDRLGLVKKSLRMLVDRLKEADQIGIAVYGSRGRVLMEHKGLDEKSEILAAIDSLYAEGSTYAEEGIRLGYEMAEKAYKKGYINRVILCSDGVANVGQTGADDILEVIKDKAAKGITLSAIGFGMGNYNDVLMERLGDKGDGHYVYVDTIAEAKRIFEDNLTGTLQVIARDVKVQVDFNPDVVRSYRLIGYENRDVPDDKFRDDKYDGGEIGAGHSVTALYELKLWPDKKGTVAATYVRYKDAETKEVTEFKSSIGTDDFNKSFDKSSDDYALAATVMEFAEILRDSYWAKGASLGPVLESAQRLSEGFKTNTDVIELVDLISKAKSLMRGKAPEPTPEDNNAKIMPLE